MMYTERRSLSGGRGTFFYIILITLFLSLGAHLYFSSVRRDEVRKLNRDIDNLIKAKKQVELEKDEKVKKLQEEVEGITKELQNYQLKNKKQNEEVESIRDRNSELSQQLSQKTQQLNDVERELVIRQQNFNEAKQQADSQSNQLNYKTLQVQKLEEDLQLAKSNISQLEVELKKTRSQETRHNADFENLLQDNHILEKQLQLKDVQIEKLKNEIEAARDQLEGVQQVIQKFNSQVSTTKKESPQFLEEHQDKEKKEHTRDDNLDSLENTHKNRINTIIPKSNTTTETRTELADKDEQHTKQDERLTPVIKKRSRPKTKIVNRKQQEQLPFEDMNNDEKQRERTDDFANYENQQDNE